MNTETVEAIRREVTETIATQAATITQSKLSDNSKSSHNEQHRELAKNLLDQILDRYAHEQIAHGIAPLTSEEEHQIKTAVWAELFGAGWQLQSILDNPSVENININGYNNCWVKYANGTKKPIGQIAKSDADLIELIRALATRATSNERRFDSAHPWLDLQLPDGSRLSAMMSVSTPKIVASIRKHRYKDTTLDELSSLGMLSPTVKSFLATAVRARLNIIVAGPMNVGKTTLLRALAAEIPCEERLVTIEQAYELGLHEQTSRHPDIVSLEARESNTEGEGEISISQLVRRSLRMDADRVIVGEVLGDEIIPMLNAMSAGRSGSMCTIHADSSLGVFQRIASYAAQASERLSLEATNLLTAGSIDLVVYLSFATDISLQLSNWDYRELTTGSHEEAPAAPGMATPTQRVISSIREVVGAEGPAVISNEIFKPGPDGLAVPHAPIRTETLERIMSYGFKPELLHNREWS